MQEVVIQLELGHKNEKFGSFGCADQSQITNSQFPPSAYLCSPQKVKYEVL